MLIDYARASTEDQHLDLQRDALVRVGCERTFEDRRSGAKADKPGFMAALDYSQCKSPSGKFGFTLRVLRPAVEA